MPLDAVGYMPPFDGLTRIFAVVSLLGVGFVGCGFVGCGFVAESGSVFTLKHD